MRYTFYFYGGGSIIGYFLPETPEWIMGSESGQCARSKRIKFLDMVILRQSFALDYAQAHQMQLMFNLELEKKVQMSEVPSLTTREEEVLFYQVLDQITSNFQVFRPPSFKQVNVVWIDPALNDKEIYLRLKKFVQSRAFDSAHPVFVSSCLGQKEIEKFTEEMGLGNMDIRFLSNEILSIFDENNKRKYQFGLDLNKFFNTDQRVIFWSPYQERSRAFTGKLIYQKY